ncbi:hypothetical protein [Leifsonia aquatica]|uniref:hypothetical protein n=1 Tax=Leifsonia aquatica TaxID=144185 RepID=UPI00046A9F7F|nr:hypothetical protein [Leifsonia aquatica]
MNVWPDGALTREAVSDLLHEPVRWRVEWCDGARRSPSERYGSDLPEAALQGVPTRAKRRKVERGSHDHRTWFFAFVSDADGDRILTLREGH